MGESTSTAPTPRVADAIAERGLRGRAAASGVTVVAVWVATCNCA